jgi:hypothetical protein
MLGGKGSFQKIPERNETNYIQKNKDSEGQ